MAVETYFDVVALILEVAEAVVECEIELDEELMTADLMKEVHFVLIHCNKYSSNHLMKMNLRGLYMQNDVPSYFRLEVRDLQDEKEVV